MRQKELWQPSKYVETQRGLQSSRNLDEVGVGSRFVADLQAASYAKVLKAHARGLLLDLGCGQVPLFGVYRDYVVDNICVDWSSSYHQTQYIDCEANLNGVLPFRKESFDTVLVTDVLEHISEPSFLWEEITRLLRPSGKVIVGVPFLYRVHEEPFDYYRYTEFALRMFCKKQNMRIVELFPYGGSFEVISDIIAKHLAFVPVLSAAYTASAKTWVSSALGRKVFQKTSTKFPLGYCLVAQK